VSAKTVLYNVFSNANLIESVTVIPTHVR
jgi:hypothetical protein